MHAALEPSWLEIVRAKKLIIEIVSDGQAHGVRTLQECLCHADGVPVHGERGEKLQLATSDDMGAVVTRDNLLLARYRLVLAASEALVDLVTQCTLVPVARAPDERMAHPMVDGDQQFSIEYSMQGYSTGIRSLRSYGSFRTASIAAQRRGCDDR